MFENRTTDTLLDDRRGAVFAYGHALRHGSKGDADECAAYLDRIDTELDRRGVAQ